jgi:hypothetical protein
MDSLKAEGSSDEQVPEVVEPTTLVSDQPPSNVEAHTTTAIACALVAILWAPRICYGEGTLWTKLIALWDTNGDGNLALIEFVGSCVLPLCGVLYLGQALAPRLLSLLGVVPEPSSADPVARPLPPPYPREPMPESDVNGSPGKLTSGEAMAKTQKGYMLRFPLETVNEAPRSSSAASGLHPFFAANGSSGSGDSSDAGRWGSASSAFSNSDSSGDQGTHDATDQSRDGTWLSTRLVFAFS